MGADIHRTILHGFSAKKAKTGRVASIHVCARTGVLATTGAPPHDSCGLRPEPLPENTTTIRLREARFGIRMGHLVPGLTRSGRCRNFRQWIRAQTLPAVRLPSERVSTLVRAHTGRGPDLGGYLVPGLARSGRGKGFWRWIRAQTLPAVRLPSERDSTLVRADTGRGPTSGAMNRAPTQRLLHVCARTGVLATTGAPLHDSCGLRPEPLPEITTTIRPGEARCVEALGSQWVLKPRISC